MGARGFIYIGSTVRDHASHHASWLVSNTRLWFWFRETERAVLENAGRKMESERARASERRDLNERTTRAAGSLPMVVVAYFFKFARPHPVTMLVWLTLFT